MGGRGMRAAGPPLVFRLRPGEPGRPALLLLHGLSGNEHSMDVFHPHLPPGMWIFSLRGPHLYGAGGYAWRLEEEGQERETASLQESLERVQRLVEEELPRRAPQARRLGLMGFSQGAFLCYLLAFRLQPAPRILVGLSGAAPLAPPAAGRSLRGLAAFLAHGTRDELVPVERGREAAELLRRAGAQVTYREHPAGHKVALPVLREMAAWLREQVGEP